MSKGRSGINVNGVKSRQHCTIVVESSPSAEIASYDYEATLSQPEVEKSHADEIEAEATPVKDYNFEKNETTKECTQKTVCFLTDNQVTEKFKSVTEFETVSISQQNITQQECPECKNIVDESGDEVDNVQVSIADFKELPKSPVKPVQGKLKERGQVDSGARREKNKGNAARVKTSLKDLARKKIGNSSLLNGRRKSKIPRATTMTSNAVRVYQTARISSRVNSKTSLCSRSFFATRNKPNDSSFITESNQASVTKTCEFFERTKGPTVSIVDIKLKESKNSRTGSRNGECAIAKTDPQPCEELAKAQVGSAGDHPSPPPATSVLKNLRLDNTCRSCNDQRETVNLELRIHDVQYPWSDSKTSPEIRTPDRWSKTPKMSHHIESTSEEVDLSSEYSSDSTRPKKKRCFVGKVSGKSPASKSNGYTGNSSGPRPRRRARFSFLNTLFDIVFWPFLFLRTNR